MEAHDGPWLLLEQHGMERGLLEHAPDAAQDLGAVDDLNQPEMQLEMDHQAGLMPRIADDDDGIDLENVEEDQDDGQDDMPDGLARNGHLQAALRGPGSQGVLQGPGSMTALGDDGEDVIQFTDEEDEDLDVTAEEMTASGKDLQNIPWERLRFSREHYRSSRLQQYRNYVNILPEDPEAYRQEVLKTCQQCRNGHTFYSFAHNNRTVATTIVHFQLRNLVWATSRNDVFVVSQNCVNHWHPMTRAVTEVINLSGGGNRYTRMSDLGKIQVSTLCVRGNVVATGGFGGELVVKRLGCPGWEYAGRISNSDNGITNGLEICDSVSYGQCILAANNDCLVRLFQTGEEFKLLSRWSFEWAVNFTTLQPNGSLVAVVGDDPTTCLTDIRTGVPAQQLSQHLDYSFAAAWHPSGYMLATGNQDTTTAVWDIRKPDQPLVCLAGRMGAIRSLRWSPDGRFLAASEPADFVHVYDAQSGFRDHQEIDLFGEISGIAFTPQGDCLYIGIADITYASLLAFSRTRKDSAAFVPSPAAVFAGHATPPAPPPPLYEVPAL